jgi:hypothetical protein
MRADKMQLDFGARLAEQFDHAICVVIAEAPAGARIHQ